MSKFYFAGLILFTAMILGVTVITGCVPCFFDIPSVLLVLLSTVIMLLTSYSPKEFGRCFSISFRGREAEPAEIRKGISFFRAAQRYLLITGGIGAMMGLIAMLATLEDPERIGKSLALTLLTVLYGLFFTMAIAVPFRTALEKKLAEG